MAKFRHLHRKRRLGYLVICIDKLAVHEPEDSYVPKPINNSTAG